MLRDDGVLNVQLRKISILYSSTVRNQDIPLAAIEAWFKGSKLRDGTLGGWALWCSGASFGSPMLTNLALLRFDWPKVSSHP